MLYLDASRSLTLPELLSDQILSILPSLVPARMMALWSSFSMLVIAVSLSPWLICTKTGAAGAETLPSDKTASSMRTWRRMKLRLASVEELRKKIKINIKITQQRQQ